MESYTEGKVKDRYDYVKTIGKGAYGEVDLCVDRYCGNQVAIKAIKVMSNEKGLPKAIFREMESLKQLSDCSYIVKLLNVMPDGRNVSLVLEYLPSDLSELISQSREHLPTGMIKAYALMILKALNYCHSRHIIHRDVKPSNILIASNGVAKLGDFGLARIYYDQESGNLSHQVATRWYRAPELLYASRSYGYSVDIWATGAIVAELFMLSPIFPGYNDIDQIFKVFQIMGTPDKTDWPEVESLPDYHKISFPTMTPIPLSVIIPHINAADIKFLSNLLQLNPRNRLTAKEALTQIYFTQNPLPYSPADLPVPQRTPKATDGKYLDEAALMRLILDSYPSLG